MPRNRVFQQRPEDHRFTETLYRCAGIDPGWYLPAAPQVRCARVLIAAIGECEHEFGGHVAE